MIEFSSVSQGLKTMTSDLDARVNMMSVVECACECLKKCMSGRKGKVKSCRQGQIRL